MTNLLILVWLLFSLCVEPWEVHYSQGRTFALKGDWKQAEAEFRLVISDRPAFLPARLALGTVLEQKADWSGAESEFRAALLQDPHSTYTLAQLAQSLMKLQRSFAAVAYWKKASELDPANLDFSIGLAAALFESGNITAAQQTLQNLAVAHPNIVKAQFSLGNLYARRGYPDLWGLCFESGSAQKPRSNSMPGRRHWQRRKGAANRFERQTG